MSHLSFLHVKRALIVLPLIFLLAFFLVGCAGKGLTSTSNNNATPTVTSQPNNTTTLQNDDQHVQDLLRSLDQAQQDADNAANNGDQQDNNQTP
jgi:PBP1b-binding outer membrane lipoprotein LpoB